MGGYVGYPTIAGAIIYKCIQYEKHKIHGGVFVCIYIVQFTDV